MEYKKTIYLLSLLYSGAAEEKRPGIGELFKQAVMSTEEFQRLKKLLQTVTFLGQDGISRHREGEQASWDLVTEIEHAGENIRRIQLLIRQIEVELDKSRELLSSPRYFDDDITAVWSEQLSQYNRFYRELANCICYYMISQFGVKSVRNLTFNRGAGFQDLMKLVNQQYANELLMSAQTPKPQTWTITATAFGGNNLIAYEGYRIEYSEKPLSSMLQMAGAGSYIRLAPYLFAAASPAQPSPFMGIGNIVGVGPGMGLSLLEAEIVTSLPGEALGSGPLEYRNLLGIIRDGVHTDCYCISPEDLVGAMNRKCLSEAVESRRGNSQCIFCGQQAPPGRIACRDHLPLNR